QHADPDHGQNCREATKRPQIKNARKARPRTRVSVDTEVPTLYHDNQGHSRHRMSRPATRRGAQLLKFRSQQVRAIKIGPCYSLLHSGNSSSFKRMWHRRPVLSPVPHLGICTPTNLSASFPGVWVSDVAPIGYPRKPMPPPDVGIEAEVVAIVKRISRQPVEPRAESDLALDLGFDSM